MPAREVTLGERESAAVRATLVLEDTARAWLRARARGDSRGIQHYEQQLEVALVDSRRASSALEKTRRRLARRAELTTTEEDR